MVSTLRAVLRVILYARVSTAEQAERGFSLAQQLDRLRKHAGAEGYEVVAEIEDRGYSGATLNRPGLDQVRDLVQADGVSVVLAQDRDRFAREPGLLYVLKRELAEHGCTLRSLNDRGDDSPEGELTDGVLDQLAKYERAKTAERTRRGRMQRAREGKIIAGGSEPYGYKYNADRSNLVVHEPDMAVVRRIFRMVGSEGHSLRHVEQTLQKEGIPAPRGGKYWQRPIVRDMLLNDLYRPHTYAELEGLADEGLMTRDVLGRLNRDEVHGIWYYNRESVTRSYAGKTTRKFQPKPRSEWIAVPVPDAGIPREWVDAAQERIKDNRAPSSAGHRFWELSGGIMFCPCGRRMASYTTKSRRADGTKKPNFYYLCGRKRAKRECEHAKFYGAAKIEHQVRRFARRMLKNPDEVSRQIEAHVEAERQALRNPERDIKAWHDRLTALERKRAGFQEQAAEGLMRLDELRTRLADLDEQRATAERELEALRGHERRLQHLDDLPELVRDYLQDLAWYLDTTPPQTRDDGADGHGLRPYTVTSETAEPRAEPDHEAQGRTFRALYEDLGLKIVAHKDGTLYATGAFGRYVLRPKTDSWESLDAVPDPA